MKTEYKTIEELVSQNEKLIEVELMLTPEELTTFAAYCINNGIKLNDWVRELAYSSLKESEEKSSTLLS